MLARTGLEMVSHPFRTRWWEPGPGELRVGGRRRVVTPNPFSAPCHVTGPVVRCDDAERVYAPGEQAWLAATDLADVTLVVNLDGAGATGRRSSVVALACPAHVERTLHEHAHPAALLLDDPWFESDHAIFAMQGVPSVAITSEGAHQLFVTVAHTPHDRRDQVDTATQDRNHTGLQWPHRWRREAVSGLSGCHLAQRLAQPKRQ